jgi:hypothetical protein
MPLKMLDFQRFCYITHISVLKLFVNYNLNEIMIKYSLHISCALEQAVDQLSLQLNQIGSERDSLEVNFVTAPFIYSICPQ